MYRYAIVTPYFKEERRLLERCLRSVQAQSVRCEHILVADGFPQTWIDNEPVRHVILDRAHGDYGNTPRGIGLLLAAAEQYDGIGLLDADNWFDSDHADHCLEVAKSTAAGMCDYVIARRNFMRPNETRIDVKDEPIEQHADSSCFFFFPGSFFILPVWSLIPKQLSAMGDRVFYSALKGKSLNSAYTMRPTVNYQCLWESVYRAAGEPPPVDAKPNPDYGQINAWLNSRADRELEIMQRLTGVNFFRKS